MTYIKKSEVLGGCGNFLTEGLPDGDTSLVIMAVILCIILFGSWQWQIIGVGTLFAMVYVGMVVRTVNKDLGWLERFLAYQPEFRRYVYGLAKYLYGRN